MLLYEFDSKDPLRVKLTAVVSQLKSRRSDTNAEKPMSTKALITLLRKNDIPVSKASIFDMVKTAPLKNIIKNISGNTVTFVGDKKEDQEETDSTDSKKQVEKMAAKATKAGS